MHAVNKTILLLLAVSMLLLPLACSGGKDQSGDQGPAGEIESVEATPEATPFEGLVVGIGDKIVVNLTVTMPKYLYLNGPRPVSVKTPGDTIFTFTSNEYYVTKPLFPLKIDFTVQLKTPFAVHKIPLALRLMYCNKADDLCHIKNDIINVEFEVSSERKAAQSMTYNIDETYEIK